MAFLKRRLAIFKIYKTDSHTFLLFKIINFKYPLVNLNCLFFRI